MASGDGGVDAAYTIEMRRDEVFPAFEKLVADGKVKLPTSHPQAWYQTDNARPHVAKTTLDFMDTYAKTGSIVIHPNQQAPRCPESNVCDLSIFNSRPRLEKGGWGPALPS